MMTKVQKWGNSLAIRIPRHVAEQAGIGRETTVDVSVADHKIVITPERGETLEALCAQITPENMHGEIDWGQPAGEEVW
ncbi:MAG: AbrB/MazE/SpoVT family DNA-binding domain-containing protein [Desulfuromonadales bacterium]